MKKGLILLLLVFAISWFTSCEKEVYDINPQMESFYMESVQLPSVTIDSVKSFSSKVEGFTRSYPWAVEHQRYPQIKENIKSASLRISITINDEWAGDTLIHF
jgi:hypothetical protein